MKRIQVSIDCDDDEVEEARKKVKLALDQLGFVYKVLEGSSSIDNRRQQK